eukprot:CAMPEP_0170562782 /NCGR_PEP_ID=MMETSP0211-20121228/62483_1 /TAXON_ID=311385 /ORGANISM="Pseudokeronopsis sp., Strain OXSARD2" /LENGTH=54 /DNA_ID=CAMNT_0010880135 /DNA_START=154 /DNA_END=318 /DNA_ORIENTATION=-
MIHLLKGLLYKEDVINVQDEEGDYLLHMLAISGDAKIIDMLIKSGAHLESRNRR